MKKKEKNRKKEDKVILVRDLLPRNEVRGGSGKVIFGEQVQQVEMDKAPDQREDRKKK